MPSVSMYVDTLTQLLIEQRKLMRWAVAVDGSPRGTEIEAAARRSVARRGGTVIADAAAADILLLAVDDAGVDAGVARAIAEGRRSDRIAGIGEAGLRLPAERAAGLWALGWHYELERFSARELNARFRRRWNAPLGRDLLGRVGRAQAGRRGRGASRRRRRRRPRRVHGVGAAVRRPQGRGPHLSQGGITSSGSRST